MAEKLFPSILSHLGTCQDLLRLLGKIIFVLESALYRKALIHEGVTYLLESNAEARVLIYQFSKLDSLDDPIINNTNELDTMPPDLSWGSVQVPLEGSENIRNVLLSEIFSVHFQDNKAPLPKYPLPILPHNDFELRLSSGMVNHENYICKTLIVRNFLSYYGITSCFNSLFIYLSTCSDEEIRELWKHYFPHSWEILLRIFHLETATFTIPIESPSHSRSHSNLRQLRITFPINMESFRTHYAFFARLIAALGDTTITIANAKYPERQLFSIQYECEDPNRLQSDGRVTLIGLCSTLTGRLVWANTSNPNTPYIPENGVEEDYVEYVVNYPTSVEQKEGLDDAGTKEDFSSNDLNITFHTTIRLNAIIGLWLPNITLSDASFLISPFRGNTSNFPSVEVIGCTVRSLGLKANTHHPTSLHHSHNNDEEANANQSSTSTSASSSPSSSSSLFSSFSWISQWSSRYFFHHNFDTFITIFQRSFLLTLYLPHEHSTTNTEYNFFNLIIYFQLPQISFFLQLLIQIIKYLFLYLQFYFHIFYFLYDFFYSILLDLMPFNGERKVTKDTDFSEKVVEEKEEREREEHPLFENSSSPSTLSSQQFLSSTLSSSESPPSAKCSWYLGNHDIIVNNYQYTDQINSTKTNTKDEHHKEGELEEDEDDQDSESSSLLSTLGSYFGWHNNTTKKS